MRSVFFCIDGHTAGNPVRLVAGGAPFLNGANMSERRQDFLTRFDWIRLGLMFEPRGHDMMSGGFVFPPIDPANDAAILFIETSGCLPMCGHGTIGMVTFAIEHGLIRPRTPGRLSIEVPAGVIGIEYATRGDKVTSVTIRNVPSYVAATGVRIDVPGLGPLVVDVAYGGNFYGIIEPQGGLRGHRPARCRKYPLLQPGGQNAAAQGCGAGASVRLHHTGRQPCDVDRQTEGGGAPMGVMLCFTVIVQSTVHPAGPGRPPD